MGASVPESMEYLESVVSDSLGGTSQPQRIRFSDGRVYAVKFDNPFSNYGLRVLPAELMASRIARHLGVPVPATCVVNVSAEFLASNPEVAFRYEGGATEQPKPGPCLGSEWIDDAHAVWPHQVPRTETNLAALAALFVAANLLCMNDDQAESHGNLLLDPQGQVWVIDWGHPFCWIGDSVNDWSEATLMGRVDSLTPVAGRLLDISEVHAIVPSAADSMSGMPEDVIAEAFQGIPEEWRSPHPHGVSDGDCASARAFLVARKAILPALIAKLI